MLAFFQPRRVDRDRAHEQVDELVRDLAVHDVNFAFFGSDVVEHEFGHQSTAGPDHLDHTWFGFGMLSAICMVVENGYDSSVGPPVVECKVQSKCYGSVPESS